MKRLNMTGVLILALALAFTAGEVRAGAWPQAKDGYYFKLSGSYISTEKEWNLDGDRTALHDADTLLSDGSFRDLSVSAYFEYGIHEQLTLIGQLPVKYSSSKFTNEGLEGTARNVDESTFGIGDLKASIRYAPIVRPLALSVQAGLKLPLGYDPSVADGGPPLGDGEIDADAMFLAGYSFWPIPVYATAGVGRRNRGGDYESETLIVGELGVSTEAFLFKLAVDIVENDGPSSDSGDQSSAPMSQIAGEQDFTKLSPGLAYSPTPGTWLTVELVEVIAGRNSVSGTTLSVGIAYTR